MKGFTSGVTKKEPTGKAFEPRRTGVTPVVCVSMRKETYLYLLHEDDRIMFNLKWRINVSNRNMVRIKNKHLRR